MPDKKIIWLGAAVGSTVGGLVPGLWHAGLFSLWSILFSGVGAIIGILAASRYLNF